MRGAAVTSAAVHPTLAELTTMRLGGPASEYEVARTSEGLVALIRRADAEGKPVLVMGGGSNLVVGDQGFDGLVVQVATSGLCIHRDMHGDTEGERVTVEAGVEWDTVVTTCLDAGLAGLEPLSGIPGSAGGTPVQNVGAYGTLTSELLSHLTVYDRATGTMAQWSPDRCGFSSHRQSVFKHTDRYVVLDVTFQLIRSHRSRPIHYGVLAERLGIAPGATAPLGEVRDAVLTLRRERGMILDADDRDTWSVGSFFINPVLTSVPDKARDCPHYPDPAGTKLAAAWLIEHAGFARGYGLGWGRGTVALSSKHALAVTNRGTATTAEVMTFAAHIREGVEQQFDIRLEPECDLVNCKLG
ncbi:MAG: UDP-N-acetylmuramate dehydrogenase [Pseudonocardiaceae bacterium]